MNRLIQPSVFRRICELQAEAMGNELYNALALPFPNKKEVPVKSNEEIVKQAFSEYDAARDVK